MGGSGEDDARVSREHCNCRGEEERQVRDPGRRHAQDAQEGCDEGGQEGDLRQGLHGEGEAGEDRGQGVPGKGSEERVLSLRSSAFQTFALRGSRVSRCPDLILVLPLGSLWSRSLSVSLSLFARDGASTGVYPALVD